MSVKIKIFNNRYPLIPFVATLVGIVILTMLGNWQVGRLQEKRELISTIEKSIKTPSQIIDANNILEVNLFQKIKLKGYFEEGQNIFLYGKRSGAAEKDGYYILSPFVMMNGQKKEILLVSRGWVPQSVKAELVSNKISLPDYEQVIEVIVMPGEKKQMLTPENDTEKNIWFRIDPKFAAETHDVTVKHAYFRQINAQNLPTGMVALSTNNLSKLRNDHLEYAISWYGLAISLLIMFIYYYNANLG